MIQEIYYSVEGYRTFSKVDAFREAKGNADKVQFHFMESWFKNQDWRRPSASWHELLRQRCQQLRDQYDWLVLWFSGGWDSTTALDAFVRNNIPVDEILIYDRKWFNDEEVSPALAYAQQVKKISMPSVRINLIDIDGKHNDEVYHKLGPEWIFAPGCSVMYPKMHRYFLYHELGQSARQISQKNRTGHIHAQEKPRILISDGHWKHFQPDGGMYQYINVDCEFFYISPDLPQLHAAQCHMAADYFESMIALLGTGGLTYFHDIQSNRFQDWRYEAYNRAIGRSCVDHDSPRYGLLKQRVHQNPMSQESTTGFTHAKTADNNAWNIYQQGLHAISEITGLEVPKNGHGSWLPNINSAQWHAFRPLDQLTADLYQLTINS